jgi:hypothetical protein
MFNFLLGVQIVGIALFAINFLVYLIANAVGYEKVVEITYTIGTIAAFLVVFGNIGAFFAI